MKKKIPKDLQKAVDKRLSEILGFVDEKSIYTLDSKTGVVFIGGERIDDSKIANLKSESEFVLNSDLWKVLNETIKHMAHEMMFTKSKNYEEMLSGKMWLYHLDIQKKIMNAFRSYVKPKPPEKFTPTRFAKS